MRFFGTIPLGKYRGKHLCLSAGQAIIIPCLKRGN